MKPVLGPKQERLRYYIVGLPSEPFEAEAAKGKFDRLSSVLTRPSLTSKRSEPS